MDRKTLLNISKNMQDLTLVLANRDYGKLGILNNADMNTFRFTNSTNGQEIVFDIYKYLDGTEENLWDCIIDLKLLWVKEFDIYFEIRVSMDDSAATKKSITGISLCEAELSQTNLYGTEINTENDIARDGYKITTFYNGADTQASLLHRVLSKAPNYTIKHVDSSLCKIQRSFSIDNKSIYDFLVGECAEQFQCIFKFDSRDRSVSVYDLNAVCQNKECNYRDDNANFTHVNEYGSFTFTCPKCGSTDVSYYGEDTGIYVDKENLTDAVQFTTDVDSLKNCFKLVAGDDTITAAVRLLNMNGTAYIYYITNEQKGDMPESLVQKIEQYDALYDSYQEEYGKLVDEIYQSSAKIYYYRNSMMPTTAHATVTAATEAAKLTAIHLSPLGLTSVSPSTSKATVESALKNYAKVYIRSGYVKLEINESAYSYKGVDATGNHYGQWVGNFKVTNYADPEDTAYSSKITVKVYDKYDDFVMQKVKKSITNEEDKDGTIFDVLSINDLPRFKEALTHYGLNRLKSFYDAVQSAMDCLVQLNQATPEAELYTSFYLPYYNKLQACQQEIDKRQATIDHWQSIYDNAVKKQQEIQAALNFENYIGEDLYRLFCCYKREDTYQNENYISDGLEDQEVIQRAQEFLETAKKELTKSATRQHSISTTLYNLLLIPEFQPLLNKFEIGNWLRVNADGSTYKLRLIKYEISFSDINTVYVEFSDVTKIKDSATDISDILQSAQSMATHYSYISKQADAGHQAHENIDDWLAHGLDSALINIKNNDREEVTYDRHGLIAREYDDVTESYGDEQLRLTHNILAFTEDGWETVSLGLGKHKYIYYNGNAFVTSEGYGISAKFCTAAYIYGSQIIGGDIYSSNYAPAAGTHIGLNDGTFSFAGGGLVYDGHTIYGKELNISASLISSTTMNASTINSSTMNASTINTTTMNSSTINSTTMNSSTINTTAMNSSTIHGTYISSGTIEGNSITGNTISGGTVTGTDIYSSNIYSGYISGGTIEGAIIKTSGSNNFLTGGRIEVRDGKIIGYYINNNEAFVLGTDQVNIGKSSLVIDCSRLDELHGKDVNILEGALIVSEGSRHVHGTSSGKEINLNADVYIKENLYFEGDTVEGLTTLHIEPDYEQAVGGYGWNADLIKFKNVGSNMKMAATPEYVQTYIHNYVDEKCASKSNLDSLMGRVSSLESQVSSLSSKPS